MWGRIEDEIATIQNNSLNKLFNDLLTYIQCNFKISSQSLLPTSILITGINQSDHYGQFDNLSLKIANSISSNTAILPARDCSNLKSAIQKMVEQFIENDLSNEDVRHSFLIYLQ